ncbi:MAG: type II toxin-antitoxin system VapC family toxin [Aquisalimonadaceae bacterium]
MTLYVLDTDISSYIIKKRPVEVLQALEAKALGGDEIVISVVTYAELMQGLAQSSHPGKHEPAVTAFLQSLHGVLPWDQATADQWAVLFTELKRAGTPIGPEDTMIAAHALSLGATLVTNNERHFCRISGLLRENWAKTDV